MSRRICSPICLLALVAACTGSVGPGGSSPAPGMNPTGPRSPGPGSPSQPGGGGAGGGAMPGGPEPGGPPTTGGPVVAAAGRLRLLTRPQLENSLRDLLGPIELPPTQQDAATHGFASVSASAVKLTDSGVEQFHGAIRTVLNKLVADPARRGGLTGECVPASAGDEACFRKLISGFGRRAWRRPLEQPETDRYTKLAVSAAGALGNDVNQGLIYGFAGLLASPNFLYRVEIGQPDPGAGNRYRYSGHELASRMSYFLTGSTPDNELLSAADSGALARADGVRAQVSRLLGSPRGREGLRSYVREFMNLDDFLTRANADEDPRYTASLRAAMAEEVVRLFQSRLDPGSDVMGLFDTGSSFVNAELAAIYGIPGVSGTDLVPVTFPAAASPAGSAGHGRVSGSFGRRQGQGHLADRARGVRARAAAVHRTSRAAGRRRHQPEAAAGRRGPDQPGAHGPAPQRSRLRRLPCGVRSAGVRLRGVRLGRRLPGEGGRQGHRSQRGLARATSSPTPASWSSTCARKTRLASAWSPTCSVTPTATWRRPSTKRSSAAGTPP